MARLNRLKLSHIKNRVCKTQPIVIMSWSGDVVHPDIKIDASLASLDP